MAVPEKAYPGLALAPASAHRPGPGTHVHNNTITASILGRPALSASSDPSTKKQILSVLAPPAANQIPSRLVARSTPVPHPGSTVLAVVIRLQATHAACTLLAVDDALCAESAPATLRREDVRGWQTASVVIHEAFRVGDVVRARVISVGDRQGYYLSTARNELGVLFAKGERGGKLEAVSWTEMREPGAEQGEVRKVAKPI